MLTILGSSHKSCDGVSRRSFLQVGALAAGGLTLADALRFENQAHAVQPGISTRKKAVIQIWLAGGPVKGGTSYGQTDNFGYHSVENVVSVHDLHATILHLFGIDHTKLTYRFQGRDFRLTDVSGEVVKAVLA